jgi:protocatechuate 3,4-dioxygenase alpha subunit
MNKLRQTPSQTLGPYFAYSLSPEQYGYPFNSIMNQQMVNPFTEKDAITIVGKVYDGAGEVIPDALVEIWQNDGEKQLIGRCGTGTDIEHRFVFYTLKPSVYDGQAPFLTVILLMRGQLIHSYTRMYFSDELELNQQDPFLNTIPVDRLSTLIAQKNDLGYTFDIHMQGQNETVFIEI